MVNYGNGSWWNLPVPNRIGAERQYLTFLQNLPANKPIVFPNTKYLTNFVNLFQLNGIPTHNMHSGSPNLVAGDLTRTFQIQVKQFFNQQQGHAGGGPQQLPKHK